MSAPPARPAAQRFAVRPSGRWPAALGVALLLAVAAAWLGQRRALRLERHLARASALPFSPRGRPAVHPGGRVFLVTAGPQLVALEPGGGLSFNKRLPAPVTPQPVLARADLLVLQAEGRLLGYSLGGEPRFSVEDDGALGDVPCADERGALYLLDRGGRLRGFGPAGQELFRTTLGLRERRRVLALPTGLLLVVGSAGGAVGTPASGELALAEPGGAVVLRRALPAPPEGAAVSPVPGELVAISAGAEVLTFGPPAAGTAPRRRLALPGPARGAPLLLPDGTVYSLVQRGVALDLCRAHAAPGDPETAAPQDLRSRGPRPSQGREAACVALGPVPAREDDPPAGPLLGRDGRIYAPFSAPGLLADQAGVLSLGADGAWRQALPAPVAAAGLTLGWSGAVLVVSDEERYLWDLEGGGGGAFHPWPMPLGNPAGSGHAWPERP